MGGCQGQVQEIPRGDKLLRKQRYPGSLDPNQGQENWNTAVLSWGNGFFPYIFADQVGTSLKSIEFVTWELTTSDSLAVKVED